MSKIVESGSKMRLEDQANSSVYDFLYHDSRRIAAFIAQFETYGVLQAVKSQESVGKSSTTKASANAGVDIATLAKGSMAIDGTLTNDEKDAAERTYDPLWRNAISLLDYLAERELIVKDIGSARIGQFVLVTGHLAAFDVGILREAWKLPAIKKSIVANASVHEKTSETPSSKNRYERRKAGVAAHNQQPSETEAGLELITLLPHSVQGSITAGEATAWFNLREESLVISSSELLLKHGIGIAGAWSVLGILDALPQPDELSEEYLLEQITAAVSLGGLMGQLSQIAVMARLMLGRPSSSFGITPLIIFGEVST